MVSPPASDLRLIGVLDQHRARHRPDPAWVGGEPSGDLVDARAKIAHLAALCPVGAYIDDRRAWLDHVPGDEVCLARGRYQEVCVSSVLREVTGLRVADGDRGIAPQKEQRGGLAHEVAPPD